MCCGCEGACLGGGDVELEEEEKKKKRKK